jgi:hypothetical protein
MLAVARRWPARAYFWSGVGPHVQNAPAHRHPVEREDEMRTKRIGYWAVTGFLAFFMFTGGLAEMAQRPGGRAMAVGRLGLRPGV